MPEPSASLAKMSVVAKAERQLPGQPEKLFSSFIDFRNWRYFMPPEFRPIDGPERVLRAGDRLRMRIDTGLVRVAAPVIIFTVDAPNEIVWGGGSALLQARHHFRFEADGEGTKVISEEIWTGLLARIPRVGRKIKQQAERIGQAQLDGFARWTED